MRCEGRVELGEGRGRGTVRVIQPAVGFFYCSVRAMVFAVFIGYSIVAMAIVRTPNEVMSVAYQSKRHNAKITKPPTPATIGHMKSGLVVEGAIY